MFSNFCEMHLGKHILKAKVEIKFRMELNVSYRAEVGLVKNIKISAFCILSSRSSRSDHLNGN